MSKKNKLFPKELFFSIIITIIFLFLYSSQSFCMLQRLTTKKLPRVHTTLKTIPTQPKIREFHTSSPNPEIPEQSLKEKAVAAFKRLWQWSKQPFAQTYSPQERIAEAQTYSPQERIAENTNDYIERIFSDPEKVDALLLINFIMSTPKKNKSKFQELLNWFNSFLTGTTIGEKIFAHTNIQEAPKDTEREFIEWKKSHDYPESIFKEEIAGEKLNLAMNAYRFISIMSGEKITATNINEFRQEWTEKFLDWLFEYAKDAKTQPQQQKIKKSLSETMSPAQKIEKE